MKAEFELGTTVMTRGVALSFKDNEQFTREVSEAFIRYCAKDWGDLCNEDKQMNKTALVEGERLLARYNTSVEAIYIITEWDRSATTILFVSEY